MTRRTRLSSSSSSAATATTVASASKKFGVFEFNEEDELVEQASENYLRKFSKPKKRHRSPVDKYRFLECFARGQETQKDIHQSKPIDIDCEVSLGQENQQTRICRGLIDIDGEAVECQETQNNVSNELIDIDDVAQVTNSFQKEYGDGPIDVHSCNVYCNSASLTSCATEALEEDIHLKEDVPEIYVCLEFKDNNKELIDGVRDNDDKNKMNSSSASSLNSLESEVPLPFLVSFGDQVLDRDSNGFQIDDTRSRVYVFPDFVQFGDMYSTKSQLIFTSSCIELHDSLRSSTGGTCGFKWALENIIAIESDWCKRVETAEVVILLKPTHLRGSKNATQDSGVDVLKFALYDPKWFTGVHAIKSLNIRYQDTWNDTLDKSADGGNIVPCSNKKLYSQRYFTIFEDDFEGIVYPIGDPDAVSISKSDVVLLQPDTFINDTIIDFYIKYLKSKIKPEEQQRFHFFNSFFFRKLADLDKNPSSACDVRAAFQRVCKWTRRVDIFGKDYIFIPVNYSLHWSLIVICYPGIIQCFKDEEFETSSKVPCILHMDSLKGSHRGLKDIFQSYLYEEWKERHKETMHVDSSKFLHLKFVELELPQQENLYDCGLFLLHYVEHFLEEAPFNFNPFKITKFSNFLNGSWFLPAEASLKRAHIQQLICELLDGQSQNVSPSTCVNNYPPVPDFGVTTSNLWGAQFEKRSRVTPHQGKYLHAKQGTEFSLKDMCNLRISRQWKGKLHEQGSMEKSLSETCCPQKTTLHRDSNHSILSPIEEIEAGEHALLPVHMGIAHQDSILISGFPSTSNFNEDFCISNTFLHEFSLDHENPLQQSLSHECSLVDDAGELDKSEYFTSSEKFAACVVEDSEETDEVHDADESSLRSPLSDAIAMSETSPGCPQSVRPEVATLAEEFVSKLDEDVEQKSHIQAGAARRLTRNTIAELLV